MIPEQYGCLNKTRTYRDIGKSFTAPHTKTKSYRQLKNSERGRDNYLQGMVFLIDHTIHIIILETKYM